MMPYYYITKKAEFTANNFFGVCGMAALFPLYIPARSSYFIYFAMSEKQNIEDILGTKILLPFTICE